MSSKAPHSILDPGLSLTLRPMQYPVFFDMFKDGIKNTWTVEEVDFSTDLVDLRSRLTPAEIHLIQRLVAFFATGDSIVSNNLVLNLYKHINSPEARLYLSRQLFEEAVHVQFYLTLLDNYVPDPDARAAAFAAVENIPSISKKADFCMKWMDSIQKLAVLFRCVRLCLLPALARIAERSRRRHQLGLPRRKLPSGVRLRGGQHRSRAAP